MTDRVDVPYIDLDRMATALRRDGWSIARPAPIHLKATHPDYPIAYEVFGDDDIAEGCCYVNGVMVDWESIDVIRGYLGKWAAPGRETDPAPRDAGGG